MFIRLLMTLLGRLPLRALHALGAALGRVAYRRSRGYRERFDKFIDQAGYGDASHAAIRTQAIIEAGKAMTELPWLWTRPLATTTRQVIDDGGRLIRDAQALGRGVILLTPHLGCFEVAAQQCATIAPITVLYSPPHQPWARRLVATGRARPQLHTAPATLAGVRQLAKALKRGELVGMLPDQVPGANEGIWTDFFGQPAYTMTLPAKLQQLSGAVMLLVFCERLPRGGGYVFRVRPFESPPLESPPFKSPPLAVPRSPDQLIAVTAQINRAMEQLIRSCPSQYIWAYSRYKCPAGVAPPPARSQAVQR